jgi:hypothetical protein
METKNFRQTLVPADNNGNTHVLWESEADPTHMGADGSLLFVEQMTYAGISTYGVTSIALPKRNTPMINISDAVTLSEVISAPVNNAYVGRLIEGYVFHGTARNICDDNGGFVGRDSNVLDAFLRVTLSDGSDAMWRIRDLMADYREGTFIVNYVIS